MNKKEIEFIKREYIRYITAIESLQINIGSLESIEYRFSVYNLFDTDKKMVIMHNKIKTKINSMEDAKESLYSSCNTYLKLMKKFNIDIPIVSYVHKQITLKKLKQIDKKNKKDIFGHMK